MSNRLMKIWTISGSLTVKTGLRVGASADTLEISGLDNPIIRNPRNGEPFIPGSSIKGRMRSLAEWYFDEIPLNGSVINAKPTTTTAQVFGISASDEIARGPTRLIVRDALLSERSRGEFEMGRAITEVKSENSINRLSAHAVPRPIERVLPGVSFDLEMIYRIFEIDGDSRGDENRFEVVTSALALLQLDALGGGGSRGNGKVSLDLTLDGEALVLPKLQFPSPIGLAEA
jgi:CRISPR-associated protein Csm3